MTLGIDRTPVKTIQVTRYVTPLREGGSLPAIVEGDDLGTYVLKFRGAGQGPKVLIAELVAGEIARALDLPMPELAFAELDPVLARSEPDPEVQDLIAKSGGLNLAIDYLPGSFGYDPYADARPGPDLASAIVWFDAFVSNVDRTIRNTNLLLWHRKLWLIDNGASLYFHFAGPDYAARAKNPFPQIRDHVLLPYATRLEKADAELPEGLPPPVIDDIVGIIPDTWLDDSAFSSPDAQRQAYVDYLNARLQGPRPFAHEAIEAHARLV